MSSRKNRSYNFHPFHCEVRVYSKGFVLEFHAPFEKGNDYTRKNIIKLHFEFWWVAHIADMIKKVLKFKKDEYIRLKNSVGFKDEQ